MDYKYKEATIAELELRWDKNIADNKGDERWIAWKSQSIVENKSRKCKTFVILHGDEPIGEGTLIFSSPYVEVNALRIDKQHEGKGHISKLVKIMEDYAKKCWIYKS
ncbi:MAG: GNAT family N-acetyltransferase [Oscillospiraceae bacterium]|nr:GNAT family N-acetyltransferase [Oscillospiraceae bacterium]